jgi:hypothetical protein
MCCEKAVKCLWLSVFSTLLNQTYSKVSPLWNSWEVFCNPTWFPSRTFHPTYHPWQRVTCAPGAGSKICTSLVWLAQQRKKNRRPKHFWNVNYYLYFQANNKFLVVIRLPYLLFVFRFILISCGDAFHKFTGFGRQFMTTEFIMTVIFRLLGVNILQGANIHPPKFCVGF